MPQSSVELVLSDDGQSCDCHVHSQSMNSLCTDTRSTRCRKVSSSSVTCIYCVQFGDGMGSYRSLETADQLSSCEENGSSGGVSPGRRVKGVPGEGVSPGRRVESVPGEGRSPASNVEQRRGELSYFEVLDFAQQIARGMEHLERMKVYKIQLIAHSICSRMIVLM